MILLSAKAAEDKKIADTKDVQAARSPSSATSC